MRRSSRAAVAALALVGALGLAACGDSSDDAAPKTDPSTAAEQKDCATTPGTTVTVEIGTFVFDPTPVEVAACDQVVWHNGHDQDHTSSGNGAQTWNTQGIAPGATSAPVTFASAGSFTYICAFHPTMQGTVEVS